MNAFFSTRRLGSLHAGIIFLISGVYLVLPGPETHAGESELPAAIDKALDKAVAALGRLQSKEGGWQSETYGVLKPGAATTALVLETLSRLPKSQLEKALPLTKKSFAFLESQKGKEGALGTGGEWAEYPTYATALALRAILVLKPKSWKKNVALWVGYLKKAQNNEANGSKKGDSAYGGWSPLGAPEPDLPRRSDISATRYVLEALRDADVPVTDPVWKKALAYVFSCQNHTEGGDGGFIYTYNRLELNKAGPDQLRRGKFNSYGSASVDGWISLGILKDRRVMGEATEKRIQAVKEWFRRHKEVKICPGFAGTEASNDGWDKGVRLYFRSALSGRLSNVEDKPDVLMAQIAAATLASQKADGTWKNEVILMKEDDPLVATAFALRTLIHCRLYLGGR